MGKIDFHKIFELTSDVFSYDDLSLRNNHLFTYAIRSVSVYGVESDPATVKNLKFSDIGMRIFCGLMLLVVMIGFPSCKTVDVDDTVYFLVAEIAPLRNDSYILPLTDPADIAQAEAMLAGREPSLIVVARIARGSGDGNYRNMNLTGPEKFSWSWHVTSFLGFAENTIEILDGWPGYVENTLEGWLANTNSTIGFWGYRIRRRVALEEMK
jgi:hypothetical protein